MFVGNSKVKIPLSIYRRLWNYSHDVDVNEKEYQGVEWFCLAQDRMQLLADVNKVMDSPVP
jgi:hypothetical protein